ncbi:MAG: aspartate aminotransferase family protein [Gemmatimonas sp.]
MPAPQPPSPDHNLTWDASALDKADRASVLHPYTNLRQHQSDGSLTIVSGKGVWVTDSTGKRYIESMAGLWCTTLGFGENRLAEAAKRQIEELSFYHLFGAKAHPPAIKLAEKLLALAPSPMGRVFFTCSGSEAIDTAIKIVWYYNNALGRPKKKKIIARDRAYHGVTIAASSLTMLPNNQRAFDVPLPGMLKTACPHHWRNAKPGESEEDFATRLANELDALIVAEGPETVAALFAEPVQGAGGVIVPPKTYFEKVQAVCRKHDVLVLADEVITGFGRTGNLWGSQTYGIKPDLLTMAKALTSGYQPLGALMVSDQVFQAIADESARIGVFGHGFTYGGHPVPCAVALETLAIYEERDIAAMARANAPRFQAGLKALESHPLVGEARGVGMVGALEIVADKARKAPFDPPNRGGGTVIRCCQDEGLIARQIGETIALSPPLVITAAEVDEMLARLGRALDKAAKLLA